MSPANPKLLPVTGVQTKSLTPVKHTSRQPCPDSPCDEQSALLQRFCGSQPYHLILINRQGEVVYLSPYLLNLFHIEDPAIILGKVNLFDEELLSYAMFDYRVPLRLAMCGETTFIANIPTPIEEMTALYGNGKAENLKEFTDGCFFPVFNEEGEVTELGILFFPKDRYQADMLSLRCREYLDQHWKEDFDLKAIAEKMGFTSGHIRKRFKKAFGLTPFQYHRQKKFEHLKVLLRDRSIEVKEAFYQCGLDYNGTQARAFADLVGKNPKTYQQNPD